MSSSSSARISISSDEVNLLVYRYLLEAGFKHTAFVFHGESLLHRSPNIVQSDMPPGSLVTLLQKALLFLYVETHVANDGQTIPCDEAFSLFKPHEHDHGPIDAPIDSALTGAATVTVRKTVAPKNDDDGRPVVKKQKPSIVKDSPSIEPSSVPMEMGDDLMIEHDEHVGAVDAMKRESMPEAGTPDEDIMKDVKDNIMNGNHADVSPKKVVSSIDTSEQ